MSSLTRRGWIVLVIAPALLACYLLALVASHLWYVEDKGYCWGSVSQCYAKESGK
jgi:hypothetical protein